MWILIIVGLILILTPFYPVGVVLIIIGLIIWAFSAKTKDEVQKQREKGIPTSYEKKCPKCAELIKKDAKVCRFCGNENLFEEAIKVSKKSNFWLQKVNNNQYALYMEKGKCCYCGSESVKKAEIEGQEKLACFNCFRYYEKEQAAN